VGEWKGKSSTADINLNNIKSLLEQKEKELEKLRTENQKQAEELLKKSTDPEIERNKIKEIILTDKWQKILGNKGLEEYEKLTTLNCQGNQLTSLPTLPSSLTTLDCSYNNLTTLPTLPSSLTTLALDFNSNPFIIDAGKFLKWDRYNLQLYLSSTINKIKVINCSKRPDTFQIWIDEKRDWKPWKEWAAMPEYKDWILP
jgi:Leucine-rich repeat (LRR) protein